MPDVPAARPDEPPAAATPAGDLPSDGPGVLAAGVAVTASVLVALAAVAANGVLALVVAVLGLGLAWGWPVLVDAPGRRGSRAVLAVGALASTLAAGLTPTDPYLRWVPATAAVTMMAAFGHQLLRRHGRVRLVDSVTGTVGGIAVLAAGVALVPLPDVRLGAAMLGVAMTGLGAAALVELVGHWPRLRGWLLPLVFLAGALGAWAYASRQDGIRTLDAVALGVLCASISHGLRRALGVLPGARSAAGQVAAGTASVLVVGMVVYVFARLVLR